MIQPPHLLHLAPGVHRVHPNDYHADILCDRPTLSSTLARRILNASPRHAWADHPRLNPNHESKDSAVFDFGRAAHRSTLGEGGDYEVFPDEVLAKNGAKSTAAAKLWEAEMREEGVTPITAASFAKLVTMRRILEEALKDIGLVIDPDVSELTALAEVDGVMCRAMIDNAPRKPFRGRRYLIDFKTTEDASPEACRRSVENYGYDSQAAFHLDAWKGATDEERAFLFIFQEKDFPHEVGFVRLEDTPGDEGDWLEDARGKMRHARHLFGEGIATGIWPGYPREIAIIGARKFYRDRWAELGTNGWDEPVTAKPSQDATRAAYMAQAPGRMTE